MKVSRLARILPVLVLVAALPAAADMRAIPASDGHPQATIEGTISSISIPFAGGGPIVTLLGGLVSFDANGATVRFGNGTAATTSSFAAGQRVLAILDPAASPLKATTVIILSDRAGVTLTGKVDRVDTAARTLTVLGLTVKVNDRTVFGGPFDGSGQKDLGDVSVGDLVLVDAKADSGALLASKVMKLASSPEATTHFTGTVETIGTDSWTITLGDGSKAVVKISPETRITGNPKVGDKVDVVARRQSDGTLLALVIAGNAAPPPKETERFQGVVKTIGTTSLTIGPKVGSGPDHLFTLNASTKITGDPKVGDEVGVVAQKQADGSWLALAVAKITVTPPVSRVEFDGVVKSITPAAMMSATWVVDTTTVLVSRMTEVKGDPKVGDKVHVEGIKSPDGTVMAKEIAKL